MVRIAVVEDNREDRKEIIDNLNRYAWEEKEEIIISEFTNAIDFLDQTYLNLDMVFMDIQMPCMNGMEAAVEFRKRNTETVLIFITNMNSYAVHGYEVNALDYIIKPIRYYGFALKMKRAFGTVKMRRGQQILIRCKTGLLKVSIHDIRYVEVLGHKVIYHMPEKTVETYGSMKNVMENLQNHGFALCNNCYCVNLYYVTGVDGYLAKLGDTQLQISHPRKKSFLKALNDYVGGNSI